MGLSDDTEALKHAFRAQADAATVERAEAGIAAIVAAHPAARALGVGEPVPDHAGTDIQGRAVRLAEWFRRGPLVLDFHRGGWCPFCSLELRAWQVNLATLRAAGGALLAVAPETPAASAAHARDHGLAFPILTDADQALATHFGLVFDLPGAAREAQTRLGAPLERHNADGSWRLPVPATYVVDTSGIIRWAHVEDDYTQRAEPAEVIEVVRGLA